MRGGEVVKVIIKGSSKEIVALVQAAQERPKVIEAQEGDSESIIKMVGNRLSELESPFA